MKKYAPLGFLLAGAGFVIPQVIAKLSGEPINGALIVIGVPFFIIAAGLQAHGRKKSDSPPAPPAR
ncbi:MAG: hypothetical protein KIT68_08160 [Phycisphaeraceae bacterium]|nr:hypothetical protein [Phycisphaeraceae bacterium]